MLGMAGPSEWMIVLLVVLVLFGGKKIPELMGGLGKGIKNFKKGMNDELPAEKEETGKLEDKSKSGEGKS